MSEPTKACNLTKAEIKAVMQFHGYGICDTSRENHSEDIERVNYLNKRLLAFSEPEIKNEAKAPEANSPIPQAPAAWGSGS